MAGTHETDGSGYAYCQQDHPVGDEEAREWCRVYHRPQTPKTVEKPAR